jgi:putative transposase
MTASTTRQYHREEEKSKLVHHSDAGGQYTSLRFTPHLPESGIDASVGTVGDALDNTLTEAMIGLRKTQLIKLRGP